MLKSFKCKSCGASSFKKIGDELFECQYCGLQVRKKAESCHHCDDKNKEENLSNENVIIDEKNQEKQKKHSFTFVKLMLCIFLGQFGVHRFVEGKVFSGILYVLTQGFFGIGILCDIIRLAKELYQQSGEKEE